MSSDVRVPHVHEPVTREEYFSLEAQSTIRHELVDGQLYAMVGDSAAHNTIVTNLTSALKQHLRGGPCRVFSSTFKLSAANNVYYPDVFVTCEPPEHHHSEDARVIIEVLSDSTGRYDATEKFAAYRTLASLKEYVLVDQRERNAVVHLAKRGWQPEQPSGVLRLESLDLEVPFEAVYEDVF